VSAIPKIESVSTRKGCSLRGCRRFREFFNERETIKRELKFGEIDYIPLAEKTEAKATIDIWL